MHLDTSIAGTDFPTGNRAPGGAGGFVLGGAAYLTAAAAIAAMHTNSPVTRGWWLVAFLSLVGGLSQLLLGPGLLALSRRSGAPAPSQPATGAELVLWNGGTATVAIANMASSFTGVVGGGVLLGLALLLFARDLRTVRSAARRPARWWIRAYVALLGFLALSVAVGVLLAHLRGR